MDLDTLLPLMARHRASRVRLADGTEAELHPSAFAAPAPAAVPTGATPEAPDADQCACGHSIGVEHNEHGCLKGCLTTTCSRAVAP